MKIKAIVTIMLALILASMVSIGFNIPLVSSAEVSIQIPIDQAISFQDEGTLQYDDTTKLQSDDGIYGPTPTGTVGYNYYATCTSSSWFDAVSVHFDLSGISGSLNDYSISLKIDLQKGDYSNSIWQWYMILAGDKNDLGEDCWGNDLDLVQLYSDDLWETIVTAGTEQLLEVPVAPELIVDSWLTIRLWNARVDYVELVLTYNTISYGDVNLSGGFQSGHFCEVWDLTASDMTISFTYDANGLVDDFGGDAHAWAEMGVREVGYGDFNPTWDVEGAGVWLATDYDWTVDTFDPDPPDSPTLDLDDKLILQKAGGHGEGDYNLPATPPNPWANHRVWWDRDGVDPWQNDETANTGGIYNVEIKLHATSPTSGTAYMTINGLDQGFETDGDWNTIELTPAGMTFTGDMSRMQVFYGLWGYGATHSVSFENIIVSGNLVEFDNLEFVPPSDSIMATGTEATLTVQVTDDSNPVQDVEVKFSSDPAGLTFNPSTKLTDAGGYAEVTATTDTVGIYTVTATVCGVISDTWTLVVYDPNSLMGMATGGGWYYPLSDNESPMDGTASFGFVAKNIKSPIIGDAKGNLEFHYRAGDINLKSTEILRLVVSSSNAHFKGIGTVNGESGYHFWVSAKDNGEPGVGSDWLSIKIWDGDPDESSTTLIHSSHNVLAGGNIMVKTK